MKLRELAISALVLYSGAAEGEFYVGLGIGENTNLSGSSIPWDDGGGIGTSLYFGYERELGDGVYVGGIWYHLSQYDVGPPFNDRDESSVDHFGVYIEYRW